MDEHRELSGTYKNRCKLYVSNIDCRVPKKVLYEMLIQTSPIANLYYPYNYVVKQHYPYCIVEYLKEQDADYAYKVLDQTEMYGKPLKFYRMRRDDEIRLYVQNLEEKIDEKILYDIFRRYGRCDVRMCWEKSGKGRCYAFVTFYNYEESDSAIEHVDGMEVLGKRLSVDYALKKNGSGEKYGTDEDRSRVSRESK